jgi:hypothetical protein
LHKHVAAASQAVAGTEAASLIEHVAAAAEAVAEGKEGSAAEAVAEGTPAASLCELVEAAPEAAAGTEAVNLHEHLEAAPEAAAGTEGGTAEVEGSDWTPTQVDGTAEEVAANAEDKEGGFAEAVAVSTEGTLHKRIEAAAVAAGPSLEMVECEVLKIRTTRIMARFPAVAGVNERPLDCIVPHVEPCEDHRNKRWVMGIFDGAAVPCLRALAETLGIMQLPFIVGRCARVAEVMLVYQVVLHDTHRPKALPFPCRQRLTFVKRGGQAQKVLDVVTAVREMSTEFFGTLAIVEAAGVPVSASATLPPAEEGAEGAASSDGVVDLTGPLFEDIVAETLTWGTSKLTNFAENTKIKKAEKLPLTQFESRLLVCYPTLKDLVRLFEDSSDMVMKVGGAVQQRACPMPWATGSSSYARELPVYVWDSRQGKMVSFSLSAWLDEGHYLSTSLLLLGRAAVGKSRALHMLSQEIAVSGTDPENACYAFGKAIDPLGILAHSGSLRGCSSLALTDFDLAAARGKCLTSETVKSLFDVPEGGVLQECRWRSCTLAPGLPRLFALNGEPASYGSYFDKFEQHGLALAVTKLEGATDPGINVLERSRLMSELCKEVKRLSADDQAALRRVGVAICRESLVTAETADAMAADTAARAAAAKARREAYWAKHSA